jgi:preprotein translocase subunit SecF
MQLFPHDKLYDFMGVRFWSIGASVVMVLASIVLIFYPGPRLGTDFKGGTEIEVAFTKPVAAGDIRSAVTHAGFSQPDVVKVDDPKNPTHYLIRVQEVSTIGEAKRQEVDRQLCSGLDSGDCAQASHQASEVKFSPGGDKITVRFQDDPDLDWVRSRMAVVSGIELRAGRHGVILQNARDHKVEILLKSKGDQLMDGMRARLGADAVPAEALRVEWIGPKAGAQLRDSALRSIAFSIVFVMIYIALRFDVRFAPGAVVAMGHDALSVLGLLIVMGREINLTTVAAILTIVGYSVNDTVIVYDRVRENLGRLRGASFVGLINVSISEMLGRTILSSGTVVVSMLAFFAWGTGSLKEFALTLVIGFVLGTYSSIYVALPLTEWLDRRFFGGHGVMVRKGTVKKKVTAVV